MIISMETSRGLLYPYGHCFLTTKTSQIWSESFRNRKLKLRSIYHLEIKGEKGLAVTLRLFHHCIEGRYKVTQIIHFTPSICYFETKQPIRVRAGASWKQAKVPTLTRQQQHSQIMNIEEEFPVSFLRYIFYSSQITILFGQEKKHSNGFDYLPSAWALPKSTFLSATFQPYLDRPQKEQNIFEVHGTIWIQNDFGQYLWVISSQAIKCIWDEIHV